MTLVQQHAQKVCHLILIARSMNYWQVQKNDIRTVNDSHTTYLFKLTIDTGLFIVRPAQQGVNSVIHI